MNKEFRPILPTSAEGERQESLPKRIVAIDIVDALGRHLCQRRALGIRHPGTLTVSAGGHQDEKDGGDDDRTLARETMEEIRIEVPTTTQKDVELFFPGIPGVARPAWLQMYVAKVEKEADLGRLEPDPACVAETGWFSDEELIANPEGLQPEYLYYLQHRSQESQRLSH